MKKERLTNIIGMLKEAKKPTNADRTEHARLLYKMLNNHLDEVKRKLDGAHPDVQDLVKAYEERVHNVLGKANEYGAVSKKKQPKVGF